MCSNFLRIGSKNTLHLSLHDMHPTNGHTFLSLSPNIISSKLRTPASRHYYATGSSPGSPKSANLKAGQTRKTRRLDSSSLSPLRLSLFYFSRAGLRTRQHFSPRLHACMQISEPLICRTAQPIGVSLHTPAASRFTHQHRRLCVAEFCR